METSFFKTLVKIALLTTFAFFVLINQSQAARISLGIGTEYDSNVEYIPGHWYRGYWVPGQYVEYAGPAPGQGYIWYQGGYGRDRHWQRGHWGRHHH